MKILFTQKQFLLILFIVFGLQISASAQNIIKGTIIDEATNEPVIGATIQVKGTTQGTATDVDGKYEISTEAEYPLTLIVSYIGYNSKEVELFEADPDLRIAVRANATSEIVIVGYGEQNKEDVVGSISTVNQEEVKTIPTGSFDAQLQGKATGVQINTNSGVPGTDVFIRVRGATSITGSNDPLYVIDGVFVNSGSLQQTADNKAANGLSQDRTTSPMTDINPADIESVEILKDASAVAIYGSRGANGVVIVTTKRGNFGAEKTKINFSASEGLAWAPKNRIWKTANGPEQAMLLNEYATNMGTTLPFQAGGRGLPQDQPTYDRLSYLFRTGHIRNYDLSFQGGSEKTRFYIGTGYNFQEAIWAPMDFNRASLKLNLDHKIGKRVTIGTSNTLTRVYRNQARPANGGNGTLLQASLSVPTYLPIFDANGTPLKWVNFDNIATLTENVNMWSTSYHYIGNLYADIELLKDLKFRTSSSLDYNIYDENQYWQKSTILGSAGGLGTKSVTQSTQVTNEQTLRYTKKFGRHNTGILIGNTIQALTLTNATASGQGFPNDAYTQVSAAAVQTAYTGKSQSRLASFFTRVDYNFNHKYYLEFTARADGSSRFGANHKWGYFPAVGGAWRIKQENFMQDIKPVSELKWRVSYGITGNQAGIGDYASRGLWGAGFGYADKGTAEAAGTAPIQAANPNLKWEQTTQFSTGLDIGFLKDRIVVVFNFYRKYTKDALLNIPVPASTGFGSYTSNYAEISNTGFELGITTTNIKTKDFTWTTTLNASRNKNVVEKVPSMITGFGGESRSLSVIQQGQSLYSYWVYNQTGVDPNNGNIQIQDVNGDGKITADDRKVMGNTWPKLYGGFNNTFTYKGIDLGVFFVYSYGNKIWNQNEALGEQGGTLGDNRILMAGQLDRWTTPGQQTMVPKLTAANYSYFEVSRFLEDASFIRLRSLTLGYTVPQKFASAIKLEKLRFYFTSTNLFLITKYTGADPESNLGAAGGNLQGYDYDTPPQPRTVQFGLNLTL